MMISESPVPHFGIVLPWDDFQIFSKRLIAKKIKFDGKTFGSIRKLAKFYKVSSGTLAGKLSRGVSVKKALGK